LTALGTGAGDSLARFDSATQTYQACDPADPFPVTTGEGYVLNIADTVPR